MPYLLLAEHYNELDPLNALVDKLLRFEDPLTSLKLENCFIREMERIRASARRDILIFGLHSHHYIRHHIKTSGNLVIRLIEVDQKLKNSIYMSEEQKRLSLIFNMLTDLLTDLMEFFSNLGDKSASSTA